MNMPIPLSKHGRHSCFQEYPSAGLHRLAPLGTSARRHQEDNILKLLRQLGILEVLADSDIVTL